MEFSKDNKIQNLDRLYPGRGGAANAGAATGCLRARFQAEALGAIPDATTREEAEEVEARAMEAPGYYRSCLLE